MVSIRFGTRLLGYQGEALNGLSALKGELKVFCWINDEIIEKNGNFCFLIFFILSSTFHVKYPKLAKLAIFKPQ